MPFDVSGNFTRSHNWKQDRDNGIRILADRHDEEDDNFAGAFNLTFLRNGVVPMTGPLNMGGQRINTVEAGTPGAPGLTFELSPATGIYQLSPNALGIATNGIKRLEVNDAGLTVAGNFNVAGSVAFEATLGPQLRIKDSDTAGVTSSMWLDFLDSANARHGYFGKVDGTSDIAINSDFGAIRIMAQGAERLRLTAIGANVTGALAVTGTVTANPGVGIAGGVTVAGDGATLGGVRMERGAGGILSFYAAVSGARVGYAGYAAGSLLMLQAEAPMTGWQVGGALTVTGAITNNLGLTAITTGGYALRAYDATNGEVSLNTAGVGGNTAECHIRPNGGMKGILSWTHSAIADRWSMGILTADPNLYICPNRGLTTPVVTISPADMKISGPAFAGGVGFGAGAFTVSATGATLGNTARINMNSGDANGGHVYLDAILKASGLSEFVIRTRYAEPMGERARFSERGTEVVGNTTATGTIVSTGSMALATGPGCEISYNTSTSRAYCIGYNRGASAYVPLTVGGGTDLILETAGAARLTLNATVAVITTPLRLPLYTGLTVPSPATAGRGAIAYITNAPGGEQLCYSDGTSWRTVADRSVVPASLMAKPAPEPEEEIPPPPVDELPVYDEIYEPPPVPEAETPPLPVEAPEPEPPSVPEVEPPYLGEPEPELEDA